MKISLEANVGKEVVAAYPNVVTDFIIQNISASDIYFLESTGQTLTDGIVIAAGSALSKDGWSRPVILGCGSAVDIVMAYQQHAPFATGSEIQLKTGIPHA